MFLTPPPSPTADTLPFPCVGPPTPTRTWSQPTTGWVWRSAPSRDILPAAPTVSAAARPPRPRRRRSPRRRGSRVPRTRWRTRWAGLRPRPPLPQPVDSTVRCVYLPAGRSGSSMWKRRDRPSQRRNIWCLVLTPPRTKETSRRRRWKSLMGRVTTRTWWRRWRGTSSLRTLTSNGWLGEHLIGSHAVGAPRNVWMDVKLCVSLQGQHRRPGGSQEAPKGGRGATHVDAGVLQRHQETLEGAQQISAHHIRPPAPPSFPPLSD